MAVQTIIALACGSSAPTAVVHATVTSRVDPEPLATAELRANHVHGTGCSWSLPHDPRPRFVMVDDHALLKEGGRVIRLERDPGAHDLFPFTYDRWRATGLTIAVVIEQPLVRDGEEGFTGPAVITIRRSGISRRLTGTVSCGT